MLCRHSCEGRNPVVGTRGQGAGILMSSYYVYILASKKNGTIYTGVTGDIYGRTYQHKSDAIEGFTKKYGVHTLVYYEEFDNPEAAINREKCIKRWKRDWKLNLIETTNPEWADLFERFFPR
jgi:putative endonuclease